MEVNCGQDNGEYMSTTNAWIADEQVLYVASMSTNESQCVQKEWLPKVSISELISKSVSGLGGAVALRCS